MICLRFCYIFFVLLKAPSTYSQSLQRLDTIKMICREWKFTVAHSDNFDDNSQDAKDFIKYTRLLFKSNMSYIYKDDGWEETNKWKYSSSKKEIILESDDGTKIIMKLIYLSSSMMKVESKSSRTNVFASGTLVPVR